MSKRTGFMAKPVSMVLNRSPVLCRSRMRPRSSSVDASPKGNRPPQNCSCFGHVLCGVSPAPNEGLLPVSLYPGGYRPAQAKKMDQPNCTRSRLHILPTAQLRDKPFYTSVTDTLSKLVMLAGLRKGLSFCSLLLQGQDVFHQFS